ncbi:MULTISPECIES: thioesterase family protein [unclassified Sinorhizobium]|uniref:thioesterase family protein n=1 Tax=unclassified Sinorhizobium TaxID=2613772 RepID=UPI0024C3CE68|nr:MULTISPECIES: thioesterase family protein [unclassified Sinorhizobium]MDK1374838.1 thioesterase family protein [Sinorhizobium sp. 6-70]MDK1479022.1 thioesterase family protein [Sinorhizobium sp. 6-117]
MSDTTELPTLRAGLRHCERLTVTPFHTVPEVDDAWPGFRDMPPVFATAMMIGFIEQTCIEALRPYLTDEQHTVGTHVDVSHVAPTPVGMSVIADVELIAVNERSLLFKVSCCDEAGLIGEGTHRRAIIDLNRFTRRLADKAVQAR